MGASFYGSASCVDATGYELYVIASAVVGGASLSGGKGSAVNAMLGAVLIVLIRQSIRTLHFDQNYEWIIIGCAIIVAVMLDQANARLAARRLARAAGRSGDRQTRRRTSIDDERDTCESRCGDGRWLACCGRRCRAAAAADGSPPAAPARRRTRRLEDRDDREELDQPGVPVGAHRRRGGRQGAVAEAQRARSRSSG